MPKGVKKKFIEKSTRNPMVTQTDLLPSFRRMMTNEHATLPHFLFPQVSLTVVYVPPKPGRILHKTWIEIQISSLTTALPTMLTKTITIRSILLSSLHHEMSQAHTTSLQFLFCQVSWTVVYVPPKLGRIPHQTWMGVQHSSLFFIPLPPTTDPNPITSCWCITKTSVESTLAYRITT